MVSHDLRTPLTSIKGFAELIRDSYGESDHPDTSEYLSYIESGANELESLTDQLLEYSRLDTGRMELSWERLSLVTWIGDLVEQLAPVLAGHVVSVDIANDAEIEADGLAVRRILTNLMQNAAKFSPAGTTVSLTVRTSADEAVFSVSDEGPGIPASDRTRVFEAFYRGTERPATGKGTGLGLAIAQRYVELHGGRIWIDDTKAGGLRISFALPLTQPVLLAGAPTAAA
jgi:signal transduction histidine kinase